MSQGNYNNSPRQGPYRDQQHQQQRIPVHVIRQQEPRPYFDPWYLATAEGGLKGVQTVGALIAFTCVVLINGSFGGTYFVCFVAVIAFIISLILLIMYLFNLVQLTGINVNQWEIYYNASFLLMFLVSTGLMTYSAASWISYAGPWGAAAFFCLVCSVAFGADLYFKIQRARSGYAQGKSQSERSSSSSSPMKPPRSQQAPPRSPQQQQQQQYEQQSSFQEYQEPPRRIV